MVWATAHDGGRVEWWWLGYKSGQKNRQEWPNWCINRSDNLLGTLPDFKFDVPSLNPQELIINFDGDPPPLGPLIYPIPYPIKKWYKKKRKEKNWNTWIGWLKKNNHASCIVIAHLWAVWICCFSSLIILFLSPITQNWWIPRLFGLFGFIFSFCFHHTIFWYLSDKLWKLKTHFKVFSSYWNWVSMTFW